MGWYTDYKKITVKADAQSGQGAKLNDLIVNQLVGPITNMGQRGFLEPFSKVSPEVGQAMYNLLEQNKAPTLKKLLLVIKHQEVEALVSLSKEYDNTIKPVLEAFDRGEDVDFQIVLNWILRLENLRSFSVGNLFASISNQARNMSEKK